MERRITQLENDRRDMQVAFTFVEIEVTSLRDRVRKSEALVAGISKEKVVPPRMNFFQGLWEFFRWG